MSRAKPAASWAWRACLAQLLARGPRCYEHNPTPEMRQERERESFARAQPKARSEVSR